MPLPRKTGRVVVARQPAPTASQRVTGGREVRAGSTSQRIPGPRNGRPGTASTRVAPAQRDTQTVRRQAAAGGGMDRQKKTQMAIAGGVAGIVVVVLIGMLLLGGSKPAAKPSARKEAPAKTLDASGHAQAAAVRGNEGLRKAREAVARYEKVRSSMSDAERRQIVEQLEEAGSDLEVAVMHYEKACAIAAPGVQLGVDEKQFIEMRKEIRRHLLELRK
jgi:hypothetical protein